VDHESNYASDPYQGTTSVVPTIMTGIKGFSPWSFSVQIVAARKDSYENGDTAL
jgi:hypothetical protein